MLSDVAVDGLRQRRIIIYRRGSIKSKNIAKKITTRRAPCAPLAYRHRSATAAPRLQKRGMFRVCAAAHVLRCRDRRCARALLHFQIIQAANPVSRVWWRQYSARAAPRVMLLHRRRVEKGGGGAPLSREMGA